MMLASAMSVMCGHSPLPQHRCIRICSGGMSRKRVVQRAHVHPDLVPEFLVGQRVVAEHGPGHRQVRAVDLEHDAGCGDRVVLGLHRVGQREDVLLVARVVVVGEERRDDSGRGRGHEHVGRLGVLHSGLEVVDVLVHGVRVAQGDRSVTGRLVHHPGGRLVAGDVIEHLRVLDHLGHSIGRPVPPKPFRRSLT